MHAFVKRWGGSIVLRPSAEDVRRLGLKEGMEVEVDVRLLPVDFGTLPTVRGRGDDAQRHDKLLHGRD